MPQTFRDALGVVHLLDLQFLWIDSLCIPQDDAEDWLWKAIKCPTYTRNHRSL